MSLRTTHQLDFQSPNTYIFILFLWLGFLELIRTAWIGDDAGITLRTVLNFLHGYGPNYNVGERVQAYTHPLWFVILSFITLLLKNVFIATFCLSIAISFFVLICIVLNCSKNSTCGLLGVFILFLSKAFTDFSTSGLENPLTHLLLILIFLTTDKAFKCEYELGVDKDPLILKKNKTFLYVLLCCSLLYLNRPDLILIVGPVLFYLACQKRSNKNRYKDLVIGLSPIWLWTIFSILYYGFPFPNTAYAKLQTGISETAYLKQGLLYLCDSLRRDPLTLLIVLYTAFFYRRSTFIALFIGGQFIYLFYIIYIGGDFMSGRLLTPVILISSLIISKVGLSSVQEKIGYGFVICFGLIQIKSTLLSPLDYNKSIIWNGIVDERGLYFPDFGLLTAPKGTFKNPNWAYTKPKKAIAGSIGYYGLQVGPAMHIIDYNALADPFLARLPSASFNNWRIGHFIRRIPYDYYNMDNKPGNPIKDKTLRQFYNAIYLTTHAPLFNKERLMALVKLNLGLIKPGINNCSYHYVLDIPFCTS